MAFLTLQVNVHLLLPLLSARCNEKWVFMLVVGVVRNTLLEDPIDIVLVLLLDQVFCQRETALLLWILLQVFFLWTSAIISWFDAVYTSRFSWCLASSLSDLLGTTCINSFSWSYYSIRLILSISMILLDFAENVFKDSIIARMWSCINDSCINIPLSSSICIVRARRSRIIPRFNVSITSLWGMTVTRSCVDVLVSLLQWMFIVVWLCGTTVVTVSVWYLYQHRFEVILFFYFLMDSW